MRKLPDDAFAFYLAFGPDRSYAAVGRRYGVSLRAVAKRAAAESWQDKIREARSEADAKVLEELQVEHQERMRELRGTFAEMVTPTRMKAVIAAMLTAAVKKESVAAARFLCDRVFGRARTEPLPGIGLDLPDGLQSPKDIRVAANALLQGMAEGALSPEDAGKAAAVVEVARKSVETEDLERRIAELEENAKRERGR